MTDTTSRLIAIIASVTDVDAERVTPDAHVLKDLELDSVDLLDVAFEVEEQLGVAFEVDTWQEKVDAGELDPAHHFLVSSLAALIDEQLAAQAAATQATGT